VAAGQSAYDVARRQREKAARLERSAAMWEQGAAGEVQVARALEALPDGWIVLHDLAWPGRPKANIDHVVIGLGGIFVVDTKNWTGAIEVRDQVLRQNGRQREQTVSSASEAAIALQRTLPESHRCTPVLCFVGDSTLSGWARNVMVCASTNLVSTLLSRPAALDPEEVERCAAVIRQLSARESSSRARRPSRSADHAPRVRTGTAQRRVRLPVVRLAGALTFLALLVSGALTPVTGWVGQQVVQLVSDHDAEPTPKDGQTKKDRDNEVSRRSRTSR
jgi:hypothetical protein